MDNIKIEERVLAYQLAKTITHEELCEISGGNEKQIRGYDTPVLTFPFDVDYRWDS